MMDRIEKIILIPRCVLTPGFTGNVNISREEQEEIIKVLFDSGTGIVQLPCPHLNSIIKDNKKNCSINVSVNSFIDKNKSNSFNRLYRKMLKPVLSEIEEYRQHGIQAAGLVGVKGSPSCSLGINRDSKKGNPGQYMRILMKSLDEKSIKLNMADI